MWIGYSQQVTCARFSYDKRAFMYLEKVYDRICKRAVWNMLRLYGVGENLLSAEHSFIVGIRTRVTVWGVASEWFLVESELKQDYVLSPCCSMKWSEEVGER